MWRRWACQCGPLGGWWVDGAHQQQWTGIPAHAPGTSPSSQPPLTNQVLSPPVWLNSASSAALCSTGPHTPGGLPVELATATQQSSVHRDAAKTRVVALPCATAGAAAVAAADHLAAAAGCRVSCCAPLRPRQAAVPLPLPSPGLLPPAPPARRRQGHALPGFHSARTPAVLPAGGHRTAIPSAVGRRGRGPPGSTTAACPSSSQQPPPGQGTCHGAPPLASLATHAGLSSPGVGNCGRVPCAVPARPGLGTAGETGCGEDGRSSAWVAHTHGG